MTSAGAWQWPRISRKPALGLLALFLTIGVWHANTVWLDELADGSRTPASRFYVWELTGALSAYVLLPIMLTAALNAPWPTGLPAAERRWGRYVLVHLLALTVYSAAHVALMKGSRDLVYAVLGWGTYRYGDLTLRGSMEWHKDLLSYVAFIATIEAFKLWRATNERRVHEAELKERLREAQLAALSAQLDPHFLFNALNTISAMMYEDLARTDRLLADLGHLLRASLEARGPTWRFDEERAYTERYVEIVLARFGDRLRCEIEIDEGLEATLVPRFVVQRLVENAIKHNPDPAGGGLQVRVRARKAEERLEIEVADDGRGFRDGAKRANGVGLRALEESLALLHGERASLELGKAHEGGARVRVLLPLQ